MLELLELLELCSDELDELLVVELELELLDELELLELCPDEVEELELLPELVLDELLTDELELFELVLDELLTDELEVSSTAVELDEDDEELPTVIVIEPAAAPISAPMLLAAATPV